MVLLPDRFLNSFHYRVGLRPENCAPMHRPCSAEAYKFTPDFIRYREKNLRRSVDLINEVLAGTKKLDLFQSARVDSTVPIEEAIKTLVVLQKEGKFDHIGVSEVSAATLRRANAVSLMSKCTYLHLPTGPYRLPRSLLLKLKCRHGRMKRRPREARQIYTCSHIIHSS